MPLARLAVLLLAPLTGARAATPAGRAAPVPVAHAPAGYLRDDRAVMGRALREALERRRIPSFSRQTGLACSACHYQFPQLTPFGRLFKLNGYTLTGLTTIGGSGDSTAKLSLKLAPIPPASAMVVTSLSRTRRAVPGTQNDAAAFPQEFSLFLSGQVTPYLGAFTQFTYAAADGSFGIDNVDLRFARHAEVGARDVLYGLTVHNNPTVQDVWNTVPAWSYPFMSSEVVPTPGAATLVDGGLSQQVVGVGGYALWSNMLYTEATVYRSAPQGTALDSSATGVAKGVAPYWRLTLQHQGAATYAMLGTFGLSASLYPQGVSGETDRFTDIGVDAQVEHRLTQGTLIGRAAFVHEARRLDATVAEDPEAAAHARGTLRTFRASASLLPSLRYGATLGWFQSSGDADSLLFAPGAIGGSRTGAPNSSGFTGELVFNPWENSRLGAQYVAYQKFNGARSDYDGARRNAGDNDTLFLYLWLAF